MIIELGAAKVHRPLAKRCGWCQAVMVPGPGPVSHGICPICREAWMLAARPALMKPRASRWDCRECDFVVNDWDGVAESCDRLIGEGCIRKDRRQPWERK